MKDADDIPALATHDDSDHKGPHDHNDNLVTPTPSPVPASFMDITEEEYHFVDSTEVFISFFLNSCV